MRTKLKKDNQDTPRDDVRMPYVLALKHKPHYLSGLASFFGSGQNPTRNPIPHYFISQLPHRTTYGEPKHSHHHFRSPLSGHNPVPCIPRVRGYMGREIYNCDGSCCATTPITILPILPALSIPHDEPLQISVPKPTPPSPGLAVPSVRDGSASGTLPTSCF